MMIGKIHTVEINGYSSGGEGIARLSDGRAVFIPGGVRADVLEVRLTEDKPRSAYAEIVRIITPSPYRIEPDCPYYMRCGGCVFRHISYDEELRAKLQRVNDAVRRIGGLSVQADEILSAGHTGAYRNKAVFHSDGASLGFYARQSREIISIDRCLLLKDDINAELRRLSSRTPGSRPGLTEGTITLRSGRNGLDPPLEEELDGLVFGISGFFQVNVGAALLLFQKARSYASMSASETLLDLYCGVGALTLFVGRDAGRALGVELNAEAIEAARNNALRNGLSHIDFTAGDAAAAWQPGTAASLHHGMASIADSASSPDCVIADPPRKGLSPAVIQNILNLSPERIVYVSCDPATLARDLRGLERYTVKELCAVDMFPRAATVECCCLLVRR